MTRTGVAMTDDGAVATPVAHDDAVLEVDGGARLRGTVRLPGAKNAALPMLVAACLSVERSRLENVPVGLNDVRVLIELLQQTGAHVRRIDDTTLECGAGDWGDSDLRGHASAGTLRHSLLLLGGAVARQRALKLPLPGGCKLGSRKHDMHVQAFEQLGYRIEESASELAVTPGRSAGETALHFRYPTFGGTLNVLYASVLAPPGARTVLHNAARNPEVESVIRMLVDMGASIRWRNPTDLEIDSVHELGATRQTVMGDRIVASTLIAATAVTRGRVTIHGASLDVLAAEAATWRAAGVQLEQRDGGIDISAAERLCATSIETAAYPGFHTDNQPLHAAMMCFAEGTSEVRETILDGRFAYAQHLRAMGAAVTVLQGGFTCVNGAPGQVLRVEGGRPLHGASVEATDIRGGGALVVAALGAEGRTRIGNLYQLERGYRGLPAMLTGLGAHVVRALARDGSA